LVSELNLLLPSYPFILINKTILLPLMSNKYLTK
jgi:hypothetical protein